MGNIAKKRRVGVWIYVYAMDNSKIVTVPARVRVLIDFQNVPGNGGTVPLEEPVNIIPINWCTAIPPEVIREWLQSPEISPPWKPSSSNYTTYTCRPRRPKRPHHLVAERFR